MLGGNGYVEESGLPRLYRQAPLNSIWEGSGNVIALDVLRAMGRSVGHAGRGRPPRSSSPAAPTPGSTTRSSGCTPSSATPTSCPCGPAGSPACWRCASRARCSCGTPRRRSRTPSAPPAWAGTGARSSAPCPPASAGRRDRRAGFDHNGVIAAPATGYSRRRARRRRRARPVEGGPARGGARTRGAEGSRRAGSVRPGARPHAGFAPGQLRRASRSRPRRRLPPGPTPGASPIVNAAGESLLAAPADELLAAGPARLPPGACAARPWRAPSRPSSADGAPAVFEYLHEPWDRWYEVRVVRRLPRAHRHRPRHRRPPAARAGRPTSDARDAARADRRPGVAALGDRAGRRATAGS